MKAAQIVNAFGDFPDAQESTVTPVPPRRPTGSRNIPSEGSGQARTQTSYQGKINFRAWIEPCGMRFISGTPGNWALDIEI